MFHSKRGSDKITKNATPIDFAYAVHTKVGNSAIGCTVNGSHATLQTILKNGDLVNIETSRMPHPHYIGFHLQPPVKPVLLFEDIGKINLLKTPMLLKKIILVQSR